MAQQVGDPFAVFNVRLVARHRLHMLGVDQDNLERAFQHVEDRSPIHPGRFEGHMGDLVAREPVGQGQQAGRGGGERAHLAALYARGRGEDQTGHDRQFVHIQSRAARIQHTHSHCRTCLLSAILQVDKKGSVASGT